MCCHVGLCLAPHSVVSARHFAHSNREQFIQGDADNLVGCRPWIGEGEIVHLTVIVDLGQLRARSAGATAGRTVSDKCAPAANGVADPAQCIAHFQAPFFWVDINRAIHGTPLIRHSRMAVYLTSLGAVSSMRA